MAAAFLGDADQVQYRPLTAPERFTALRSGEIDLLSRNTTHTLSRDAEGGNGLGFAPVVFHDGQGLIVPADSGVTTLSDLSGKAICVGSGTTTEQNLNDAFESKGILHPDQVPGPQSSGGWLPAGALSGHDLGSLAASRSPFRLQRA